jgi:actin-related protein 8
MIISTQHLMPLPDAELSPPAQPVTATASSSTQEADPNAMAIDQQKPSSASVAGTNEAPIEIIDVDDEKTALPSVPPAPKPPRPVSIGKEVDIPLEASKLPLDVGIFNSTRSAGGDDKIRKYLQAVLVIGGTALIPGMAHALESR